MTTATSDELAGWLRRSFPDFQWENAETQFGAFHDVVTNSAEHVVGRVVHGTHHRVRAARETAIVDSCAGIQLSVQISRLVAGVVSDDGWSGYVVSHLPGHHVPPAGWGDLRESYAALLSGFAEIPTAGLGLPPARTWCGGVDFAVLVDVRLGPLLGTHANAARRAVDALMALTRPAQCSFVHGDFGAHNILWEGARPVSLIDLDHACVDDPAIDIAPLVGAFGAHQVADIAPDDLVRRAMIHRATLSLQVAAAAHLAGNSSLRDHALSNFTKRCEAGTLHDPNGHCP